MRPTRPRCLRFHPVRSGEGSGELPRESSRPRGRHVRDRQAHRPAADRHRLPRRRQAPQAGPRPRRRLRPQASRSPTLAVNAEDLDRAIRVLHARTFDLTLDGTTETVLIKELQWDHLGKEMVHVDFERRDLTERVKVTVPVELRAPRSPPAAGVLDQPLHQLHVECELGQHPGRDPHRHHRPDAGRPDPRPGPELPEGVKVLEAAEAVVVQLKLPGVEAGRRPRPRPAPPSRKSSPPRSRRKAKRRSSAHVGQGQSSRPDGSPLSGLDHSTRPTRP